MATQAQIQANRLNAQKSTGPRTDEGKAVVAQNALKHGLRTEKAVIAGEDLGQFEFYRDELLGELAPAGAVESVLAERVVNLSWRLRRAERAQNEVFDALLANDAAFSVPRQKGSLPTEDGSDVVAEETPLGRAVVRDFTYARVLDRLSMYERRIEYSLYKTMSEFRRLRLVREVAPGTEKPPRTDERWGKPHPACATEPGTAEPLRAEERWGKPHPACVADEATVGSVCAGGDEPSRRTNPIDRGGNAENPLCDVGERQLGGSGGWKAGHPHGRSCDGQAGDVSKCGVSQPADRPRSR